MSKRGELLTYTSIHGTAVFRDYEGFVIPDKHYWRVEMGRLDWLNGPSEYLFPSEAAAFRFGAAEKLRASQHEYYDRDGTFRRGVDRDIAVRCLNGYAIPIELTDLGDIPDDDEDA
ncbi:hypothetical protein SEA_SMEADLEY_81 [Mycobacterium phage Smeadley]|uniref:Uncharacterized protein n=1 Tax=Mycobacterium phage Smeadley TaxID=1673873 RepID=A0A0H4TL06_9CAUD|nr:hypothetical protein AVT31_gp026 [Mycobacterium phage Smeadley]AKQ07649.1 hypothetical protein SEA_SMEADLEY_81 [Mycobacterium phage Smeadley]WNO26765.1 hypothetical protein SEA_GROUNDHOG_79 [Mycobacterium phage Groundhog]